MQKYASLLIWGELGLTSQGNTGFMRPEIWKIKHDDDWDSQLDAIEFQNLFQLAVEMEGICSNPMQMYRSVERIYRIAMLYGICATS